MAEFRMEGLAEVEKLFGSLENIPEDVQDEMLRQGAAVLEEEQRKQARAFRVQDTGLMIRKIKLGRIKRLKDGSKAIYITPTGTRTRGKTKTRNAEIAFIAEYGKKTQKARPFLATAMAKAEDAIIAAEDKVYGEYLEQL